jgi:hypothetical protein
MTPINTAELDTLIAAEKWPEAKRWLEEYFGAALSTSERGAAWTQLAAAYLKVRSKLNADYEAALDDAIGALRELDTETRRLDATASLTDVRQKLDKT